MSQDNSTLDFTANDQMIVAAAKLIRNDEAVYVGVGLPMFAALLAKRTHAPDCTFVIENGIVRTESCELPAGTDTLGTQYHADKLAGLSYVSYLGQAGFINLGFIGAGQVDRFGNVNDTVIGDYYNPTHRWPGSGGANDVMSFCNRTCVILNQDKRRFPEKVDFNTCPGYFDGKPGRREELGMRPGTGPVAVVTDLACYEFENGEMVLKSIHTACGVTLDKVIAETGWDLKISLDLKDTPPPTEEELVILRDTAAPLLMRRRRTDMETR
jgi:acyl CoA:acetate/3-ketoacid CoA transferase beta subunit